MFELLAQVVASTPFEWASSHLHLVGWPAITLLAWQVGRFFSKLTIQVTKTVTQIDHMATNHFPHMQESLGRQDIFLENIDKNIGRMADKL